MVASYSGVFCGEAKFVVSVSLGAFGITINRVKSERIGSSMSTGREGHAS